MYSRQTEDTNGDRGFPKEAECKAVLTEVKQDSTVSTESMNTY